MGFRENSILENAPNPGGGNHWLSLLKCTEPWWGLVEGRHRKMHQTLVGFVPTKKGKVGSFFVENAPNPGGVIFFVADGCVYLYIGRN